MRKTTLVLLYTLALAAVSMGQAQSPKIAVIGLVHSHVWGHLKSMLDGGAATLVGIAEPNAELVAEAKRMGARDELFFTDYRTMLEQTRPDIVWAFVENNRHLEIVQACAPRKIHVMFEKPLAATFKDALAIRQLSRQHGIYVMTNYQMAWWPTNYAAKEAADRGQIGTVWRLHGIVGHGGPGSEGARNKYFFAWLTDPVKNGGGALVDFGCYNALWSLWYFGKPKTVFARVHHVQPERFPKVEDNAVLILDYGGRVGIFEGSWDLPRSFQDLEVFGRQGSLYVTREAVELRQSRKPPEKLQLPQLPPEQSAPIPYMVHCIRSGQPPQGLVGLDINVDVVEILEAARRSVATGRAIQLPLR